MEMIRSVAALARVYAIELAGLVVGVIFARSMLSPGTIGFAFDWNVPATAAGLRVWGTADFLPLWSTEFGLLVAYPTELYMKLVFWLAGVFGLPGNIATALFLILMFALCFIGMARFVRATWGSPLVDQAVAGLLYTASPVLFDGAVTGYLTFIFSYAMMPWMLYHLVLAVRGEKRSWPAFAFFFALSLSQIQYVAFDVMAIAAVLFGLRANLRAWAAAAGAALISGLLCYSFILWNVFLSHSIVGTTAALSGHSWTSLDTPGFVRAVQLVPSVYPYFDSTLGPFASMWHIVAILWVVAALCFGFTSRSALGKALAGLLVVALFFLNGVHWPTAGLFTWLLSLPGFALFRNVNYMFGVVSFSLAALVVLPFVGSSSRAVVSWRAGILVVALIWALPFFQNQYTQWVAPIPNVSGAKTLVGPASRTLVFPHNEVIDKSHPTLGGTDPYSVQTITPAFIRDAGSGAYDAVLEDRIVDWTPTARNLIGAMEAGGVNSITLRTGFDSLYPRYVNAYDDLWLRDTYSTANFASVLDNAGLRKTTSGSTSVYASLPASAAETANAAAILDGSIEDEIAMRASGFHAIYVPATDLAGSKLPDWSTAFVQSLDALPLVASEFDANSGAALSAGLNTTGGADFHKAWVELLGSQNWWLSSRLMQEPQAAITADDGAVLRVPVPHGVRHVWIQYFASAFGGAVEIERAASLPRIIDTHELSFGAYHWLDLGTVSGADFDIRSLDGFNAIGRILMLTPDEEHIDRERFTAYAALPTVRVLPDITFAGSIPFKVFGTRRASLLLTNVSQPVAMSLSARLLRRSDGCHLQIADVQFKDYRLTLDGHGSQPNGSFVDAGSFRCGATTSVLPEGEALTQVARRIALRGPHLEVGEHTIALQRLPLAFPPLASGSHVLTISYAPLIDYAHQRWSAAADATFPATPGNVARATIRRNDGRVVIHLATQKDTINTIIRLRRLSQGETVVLTGSYRCSPGSKVQFDFLAGAKQRLTYEAVLGGDGTTRDFHMWMTNVQVPTDDVYLFLYLVPGTAPSASGEVVLNDALPVVSANLLVAALPISIPRASFSAVHAGSYDRATLVEPKRVVQYDQTFDPRWRSQVAAQHLETQTGFNLFVGLKASVQDTVGYSGARTFFWLAVFSTTFTLGLGLSALLLPGRFAGAARKKQSLA
jgi:hypothetical protein